MGSQPMGIDEKNGLTVVACIKDVSATVYIKDCTPELSQYSQPILLAHSNGSVFFTGIIVDKGEWL